MNNSIRKEDYENIYKILDTISPVSYDCGKLCDSICCTCKNEEIEQKDMVIYLLPGEEKLFIKEESWYNLYSENSKYYEYPKSWDKEAYFIRCNTPPICDRKLRPIQCRTYPLAPYINKNDELHLIYDKDGNYECPLIEKRIELNKDFIEKTYNVWKQLIKNKLIFDLVKLYSEEIEIGIDDYII